LICPVVPVQSEGVVGIADVVDLDRQVLRAMRHQVVLGGGRDVRIYRLDVVARVLPDGAVPAGPADERLGAFIFGPDHQLTLAGRVPECFHQVRPPGGRCGQHRVDELAPEGVQEGLAVDSWSRGLPCVLEGSHRGLARLHRNAVFRHLDRARHAKHQVDSICVQGDDAVDLAVARLQRVQLQGLLG
jgi:hypothetical protein